MSILLYNAFLIIGIHLVTRDDKLLGFLRSWFQVSNLKDNFISESYTKLMHLMTRFERLENKQTNGGINKMDFQEQMTNSVKDMRDEIIDSTHFEIKEPNKFLNWIANPLFECTICMSSFWGIIGFFAFAPVYNAPCVYAAILLHCLMVAGITGILSAIYVGATN